MYKQGFLGWWLTANENQCELGTTPLLPRSLGQIFNFKGCGPHPLFITPRRYAQLRGPRTTKYGLHGIWTTPEKQSGKILAWWVWGLSPAAIWSSRGQDKMVSGVSVITMASEETGTTLMTSIVGLIWDITCTNQDCGPNPHILTLLTLVHNLT